ncbi:MAG: diguanylate cyclase [Proteobacteria bacterium]|nr:diguanylate cyclase [Pseudomonadota bacterium]
MATPLSIPPTLPRAPEPAGRNAQALYDEGLALLRRLAGATWTDHNLHDPGITILELVTWAQSELGYRAELPLEDLLTPPPGASLALADRFHRARRVLPTRPLTALDWRKQLIDLPGVKNAWIMPADAPPLYADLLQRQLARTPPAHSHYREVRIRGLYRVAIDFMDAVNTQAEREPVLRAVRATLEAQRNLCEDFVAIEPVPTERFALCAELDLEATADVTEVAARLLFAAAQAIAPPVPSYSLAQMRARPLADGRRRGVDDIFDGPALQDGFIDEADLAASELPAELRLSDLIGVLMDVPGVRAISDIVLNPLDSSGNPQPVPNRWRVPVTAGHLPRLAIDTDGETPAGRLVFRKRGLPVAGWNVAQMPTAVRDRLDALLEAARQAVETPRAEDLPVPDGRWRDLAAYRSVQLDFPPLYGLGVAGLAGNPDAQRQAQVLQLKAYLTFFDQQIANDLAQLAQAARLLSVAPAELTAAADRFDGLPDDAHVLAAQTVDSIVGHDRVYAADVTPTLLANLQETPAEAATRQHRLLDHLLARLGEDFSEYAAAMASAFAHTDDEVIADKCAFLADAAELSANRAGAYDQSLDGPADLWNSFNVSGLEKRLARLLGIADFSRRNLGAVSYETYAEIDTTPGDEFRFRIFRASDNKILLSSTANFATREDARARMIAAITRGQQADDQHYRIIQGSDQRFYFSVVDVDGHLLARRVEGFPSEAAARNVIADLADYLRDHYSGEGLYLIENLLLRPGQDDDPLLPICVDGDCSDCADADPYSWRLQIVLPAYAGRFQQMDFRNFAEHVIRSEVPAHLLPKICWVNADDMARFELAYRDWLSLHAGVTSADRQAKLQALIDALTTMKNIYPQRTLFDCFAESPKPPFVLGSTALGSAPDHVINQETDHG